MRDRLIELLNAYPCMSTAEDCFMESISSDLADYLLANGVIVPPVKVGDYLYFIQNNRIVFAIVENILKNHSGLFAYVFELDDGDVADEWSIPLCDFGKTVFLTREEAKRALRKEDEGK